MESSQKTADIIHLDCKKTASIIPLSAHVKQMVGLYFAQLNGHDAVDLYAMVLSEVEKPLLEATLEQLGYNQTKAAKALGLSRSTLRKKLDHYGIS
jgi:Fis family transcriptional regulator